MLDVQLCDDDNVWQPLDPESFSGATERFFGLFSCRERWGLSWRGWLVALGVVCAVACSMAVGIHPFLAITHRTNARILVVEGWVHEYAIRAAVAESKRGHYERVFTTGGPVVGSGGYTSDYSTSASVGAELLKDLGLPDDLVQMVPSHVTDRDRTFSSAVALRNWLEEHNMQAQKINVVTEDAHARRTRLLFQKALGEDVEVGIISVPNPDYDASHWWRYSEGVRETVGETVAYLYARFLFRPAAADRHPPSTAPPRTM